VGQELLIVVSPDHRAALIVFLAYFSLSHCDCQIACALHYTTLHYYCALLTSALSLSLSPYNGTAQGFEDVAWQEWQQLGSKLHLLTLGVEGGAFAVLSGVTKAFCNLEVLR
jgi:hypothetical protein